MYFLLVKCWCTLPTSSLHSSASKGKPPYDTVFLECLPMMPFYPTPQLLIPRTLHSTTGRVWFSRGPGLIWKGQNLQPNSLTQTSSRRQTCPRVLGSRSSPYSLQARIQVKKRQTVNTCTYAMKTWHMGEGTEPG